MPGSRLPGAETLPRVRRGGRAEATVEDVLRDDEIDPFLSSTARLTAAVPFQALSGGQHIFVFRQAVAAGDADGLVRTAAGTLSGGGANGTAVAAGALLCDRFVLAGGELRPVMEVRYRRSRHRTRPDSAKDSLGISRARPRPARRAGGGGDRPDPAVAVRARPHDHGVLRRVLRRRLIRSRRVSRNPA